MSRNWSPKRLVALAKSKDPIKRASALAAIAKIKADVMLARRFFHGYEKVDLRNIGRIDPNLLRRLRKKLESIRPTLASNYTVMRAPKSSEARKAIEKFADRKIPKNARTIPIGVGPNTKIKIVSKGKRATVRVERKISSTLSWVEQTWYFDDYAQAEYDLDTEEGVTSTFQRMIDSGDLPQDGWYVLTTGAYGNVGTPNTLRAMLEIMVRLFLKYETEPGKVEQFVGVRLVGFTRGQAYAEYEARFGAMIERRRQRKALARRLSRIRAHR